MVASKETNVKLWQFDPQSKKFLIYALYNLIKALSYSYHYHIRFRKTIVINLQLPQKVNAMRLQWTS